MVTIDEKNYLAHYGILRRSGRYPWGSGGNVEQRSRGFLDWLRSFRNQGMSEAEIAQGVGLSTTELRAVNAIAKNKIKMAQIAQAQRLNAKGMSKTAAAAQMGIPESSYRALLSAEAADRADILTATSNSLKAQVDANGILDVGKGIENHMGVSKERKDTAIAMLSEEGYTKYYLKVRQLGTGKDTSVQVLAKPGMTYSEAYQLYKEGKVGTITQVSDDGGRTFYGLKPPKSVDPSRVAINYKEDGGADADGVIYVRPGVDDLSLGGSSYAQVRIKVGDGHYLKGMAVYNDNLPDGVDLVFNTNKSDTGNKLDAFKPLSDDPDNPFGAQIKRQLLDDKGELTSAMNIVNEEGDWNNWSRTLSSQVLSKQNPSLARDQLRMTYEKRQKQFEEINALTNPIVKQKLLLEFAEGVDAAAVHLNAAAMPRQRYQVILPINSLKETEVFAPNYRDGEEVVLIRYPHGGTFEIPTLRVNNSNRDARRIIGAKAQDAIGINAKVAERLSGADFDGDTVLVIPNNQRRIKTSPELEGLRGFDPKSQYGAYDGMRTIDGGTYNAATRQVEYSGKPNPRRKQQEMGDVSNLITDMTIRQASHAEIARAVRHSMVVIDSEKHALDYKRSYEENGIRALKEKYQVIPGGTRGASTLISRATSPARVAERKPRPASEGGPIDKETGRKVYVETGGTYTTRDGVTRPRTTKSTKLAEVDDANLLSTGTPIERVYADHSNRLKRMANEARRIAVNTPRSEYSPSAARVYSKEVASLNDKLDLARRNAPRERQAQILANAVVRAKRDQNPNMDDATVKKISYQALEEARTRTGARKQRIRITPEEWDAIQAGAVSSSKLTAILDNADMDVVRELATPRSRVLMTPTKIQRAQAMLASGATRAEVASALGVSLTTLYDSVPGDDA